MDVQIDITNTKIETQRLILRSWAESDVNEIGRASCRERV